MTLRLIPEILDSIDVIFSICEEFGMIDPIMKITDVESILGFEQIGVNNAFGCYLLLDDRQLNLWPCVRGNGG